ncbi:neuropathy target esterase isoform X1 [Xenopus tropicalis]|uniref:lysophospholipase n=1 Tax=Xenopus tropicalis TaxID=8364 RepID=A0A8J1JEX7_XENTR|nr:neuropathy target esterase isoform X1 [Xenopus tropicalis]
MAADSPCSPGGGAPNDTFMLHILEVGLLAMGGVCFLCFILWLLQRRTADPHVTDIPKLQAPKMPQKLQKKPKVLSIRQRIRRRKWESPSVHHTEPPPVPLLKPAAEPLAPTLPPDVLYMLQSVRVLGHFERPLFLALCQHVVYEHYDPDQIVFCPGQPDSSIYIVLEGKLELSLTDPDGTSWNMKSICQGDNVHSLLSILDVLTGHQRPYRTVTARAVEKSTLLRLPVEAFCTIFKSYPQSLVRTVQIIALRLQRVTFLALHHYLGLTIELFQPEKPDPAQTQQPKRPRLLRSVTHNEEDMCNLEEKNPPRRRAPQLGSSKSARSSGFWRSLDCELEQSQAFDSLHDNETSKPNSSTNTRPLVTESEKAREERMKLIESGKKQMAQLLNLKNVGLLDDRVTLHHAKADTVIARKGEQGVGMHLLLSGCLHVYQGVTGREDCYVFETGPGEMIGQLTVLTGEPLIFTIRAIQDSTFLCLSRAHFYQILRSHPHVLLTVAHSVARRVSPFVRQVDFAIDWMGVEAGKELYRMGDPSDCTYIALNGRLRSVIQHPDGKKCVVGEHGRGELIGMVEALTHRPRATSVHAVRDSELAKVPDGALSYIKKRYPQVVTRLIHFLSQKVLGNLQEPQGEYIDPGNLASNLCTVCVLPCNSKVPLTAFTLELKHALNAIGPTLVLTSDIIRARLGAHALESTHECQLSTWLAQQEDLHRIVLYQTEPLITSWTVRCIRQADCILVVGLGGEDPALGELEIFLESSPVRALKQLVLLHHTEGPAPSGTVEWINLRSWVSGHFHIQTPRRVFTKRPLHKVHELYSKVFQTEADRHSDFSRLARALTGNTIALVLGGGGARGFAHVGVIKALEEAGIPVDMVGGTSMGAVVGGVYAEELKAAQTKHRTSKWAMARLSMLHCKACLVKDRFRTCGCHISASVLTSALLQCEFTEKVRVFPYPYRDNHVPCCDPFPSTGCLWRYVRASASYTPYLPPLCDPRDSHLLLDGCYVNNLPADVAHSLGARTVLAVDVGQQDKWDTWNYGDSLSGWWLLWKRINPWAEKVKVPDMAELQCRLSYVSGVNQLELVKLSGYCEYLSPPVQRFSTTDFHRFQEIYDVGYDYGKLIFTEWYRGDVVEKMLQDRSALEFYQQQEGVTSGVPGFTDLAEIVSCIEPVTSRHLFPEEQEGKDEITLGQDMDGSIDGHACETDEEKTLRLQNTRFLAKYTERDYLTKQQVL